MKVGRIEFGLSHDANGKVAPFELHYNRGCCDCIILTLGWFYLTWLSEECRYVDSQIVLDELEGWEDSAVGNERFWEFEDIPKATLEDWTWETIACPSCGNTDIELHKDCHDKNNILYDWNLCRKCGADWMTDEQTSEYHGNLQLGLKEDK